MAWYLEKQVGNQKLEHACHCFWHLFVARLAVDCCISSCADLS